MAVEGRNAPLPLMWLDMLFALGVLGVCGFLLAAAVSDAEAKSRYVEQLLNALLFPLGASMVSFGLWATHRVNPVYDTRIYAFEEILGFKFSIIGVKSYHLLRPFSGLASACYAMLAVAMTVVAGAQGCTRRERNFLTATVVAGACGFALYFLCPVVGPLTAFRPLYPNALPDLGPDAPLLVAVDRSAAQRHAVPPYDLGAAHLVQPRNAAGEVEDEPQGIRDPDALGRHGPGRYALVDGCCRRRTTRRCRAVGIRALARSRAGATLDDRHGVRGPDSLVAGGDPSRLAAPRPPADAGLDHRPGNGWLASWSTAAVGRAAIDLLASGSGRSARTRNLVQGRELPRSPIFRSPSPEKRMMPLASRGAAAGISLSRLATCQKHQRGDRGEAETPRVIRPPWFAANQPCRLCGSQRSLRCCSSLRPLLPLRARGSRNAAAHRTATSAVRRQR